MLQVLEAVTLHWLMISKILNKTHWLMSTFECYTLHFLGYTYSFSHSHRNTSNTNTSAEESSTVSTMNATPTMRATRKRKRKESSVDEADQALLSRLDKLQQEVGEAAFEEHVAACLRLVNVQ